jgi:dinuclear metal center YbgI/SA1388 family protein
MNFNQQALKIREIIDCVEEVAPVSLQESWDNCGLLAGDSSVDAVSALITLDVTEAVIDEAIANGDNLIIAHHPFIFSGLKKVNGKTETERILIKAIKNDIAIYAAHTNIDVVKNGVSWMMARKLGLQEVKTLSKGKELLKKLVVFVPESHAAVVRNALFEAGAGRIGNYGSCSFNSVGEGTFCGDESTKPFIGQPGELCFEKEIKVETVFPFYLQSKIVAEMTKVHPYEEVAYDIYSLENKHDSIGLGVVGTLKEAINASDFLAFVKETFCCQAIRVAGNTDRKVQRIALCGGSGSSLISEAMQAGAEVFITGDIKYHQFFEGIDKMVLADIGHYESEQFTKELFYEIVTNKFSKFAIRLSEVQTNPVKYLF